MAPYCEKVRCKGEFEFRNLNGSDSNFERCFRHKSYCFPLIAAHMDHRSLIPSAFMSDKVPRVLHLFRICSLARAQRDRLTFLTTELEF